MTTVISPKFSDVFSFSRLAPHSFFVKGTRRLFCECYYGAERYPIHWLKLIQACERLELPSTCEESSSPINAHSITRSYPFLDGGLISREGNSKAVVRSSPEPPIRRCRPFFSRTSWALPKRTIVRCIKGLNRFMPDTLRQGMGQRLSQPKNIKILLMTETRLDFKIPPHETDCRPHCLLLLV